MTLISQRTRIHSLPTRRDFLTGLASAASLGWAPGYATTSNDDELRQTIVERARGLAASSPKKLSILLPQGSESNILPIAQSFTAATGVDIEFVPVPVDDVNSRLILATARNAHYDVALPATFGIPDLVEAGALRPLDGYKKALRKDNPQDRSDYWLGDYYNDRLYGFQTDGDVYVMFYNQSLLEDKDLAEEYSKKFGHRPQPAKTWQEADRLMEFYHRPREGLYGGALFRTPEYIAWEYWIRLHAKGVLPFDSSMRPQIQSQQGVEAAEELARASRFLVDDANRASLFDNWRTFNGGNVLCNIGWGGSQKYFRSNRGNDHPAIVAAPTPGGDPGTKLGEFSYFNWGWNFSVPVTSREPELGFLFARFAVTASESTVAVRAPDGFFDPFRSEHYADAEISDLYGSDFLSVHRHSMQNSIPDLYLRGRTRYMSILSDYLLQINRREIPPQSALTSVSQQWEELTDSLGRSEQVRQWQLLLQRYPASLQALQKRTAGSR